MLSNDHDVDEVELVKMTCDGDREAARHLFVVVLGPTIEWISRYWQYSDLMDELFVHLSENNWRRLRTWKGTSSLKSWVRTVATRVCAEAVKEQRRSISLSDDEEWPIADENADIVDRLMKNEAWLELLKAIERLEKARDRLVLRMHYFEARSLSDIAVELGIPLNTVYVVKNRALVRLRQEIEGVSTNVNSSRR